MPVGQAPDQVLQQALHGMVPEIKPYEALAELNSRVKSKQLNAAQQGAQSIQQALQLRQQPTIAQTLMQQNQALDAGIGQLNVPESQSFAGGGIVAFADGGDVPYTETYRDENGEYVLSRDGRTKYYKNKSFPYNTKVISPYASGEERAAAIEKNLSATPTNFPSFGPEGAGEIPKGNWYRANDGVQYEYPEAGAGRGFFLPPAGVSYPGAPKAPERIVPPSKKEEAKERVKEVTRTGKGSGGGSAKSALKRPVFDLTAPEYESPEARDAASFAAEADKLISPRMSEYDQRMRKYRDKALAMQRGEGLDKPSRLKRGIDSALSGATDEVMAARRAGIRPSLGMALASAGKAASASDKEYKDKLAAMQEKGFEREFALEQARIAQERGEQDRAQKWMGVAEQRSAEIRRITNAGKDKQFDVDKLREGREMDLYKIDKEAELARERMANDRTVAGIRAASGSDDQWKMYNAITQRLQLNENYKKAAALKASPIYSMAKPGSKAKSGLDQQIAVLERTAAEDTMRYFAQMPGGAELAKQILSGTLGTAPGATPGAAAPAGWGKAQLVTP